MLTNVLWFSKNQFSNILRYSVFARMIYVHFVSTIHQRIRKLQYNYKLANNHLIESKKPIEISAERIIIL